MRQHLTRGLLLLALAGVGCAAKAVVPPPAPTPASEVVRIARIVRLMELNRQRVSLEIDRVGLAQRYGDNHPDMVRLRAQIATIDAELKREFLPEEQAAVARYDDRAMELRLRLAEHTGQGRGENHPAVVATRMQLAAVEEMAREHRTAETTEAALISRISETPDSPEPQIELALFYLRANRAADAARALDRALTLLKKHR